MFNFFLVFCELIIFLDFLMNREWMLDLLLLE